MNGAPLLAGFALDLAAGDPARCHPVAGFGAAAAAAEAAAYRPTRTRGAVVTAGLVAGAALAGELTARLAGRAQPGTEAALLWAALGGRSLRREADRMATLLQAGELEAARRALPVLCGRDPGGLDGSELCRATVESVAENTADAVVGALLWAAAAGPAGVAGYRAINTLDAMFGHHDARYERFGWAAARLDDVAGWPAARLTATLACLLAPLVGGRPGAAATVLSRDGAAHPSPNAGRAEAAFAGALGLRLGGPVSYAGRRELRPALGDGRPAAPADVRRATRLSLAVGCAATALCAAWRSR